MVENEKMLMDFIRSNEKLFKDKTNYCLQMYSNKPVVCETVDGTYFSNNKEFLSKYDLDHLLEMRIFNKEAEIKIIRGQLGGRLLFRLRNDSETLEAENHFDETQYLSIDEKKSKGNKFVATGGGSYEMPFTVESGFDSIKIRNYIEYSESGNAQIVDFRIVAFTKKAEEV